MYFWNLEEKKLELLYNWKISRNESWTKTNFIVKVTDGKLTGLGEVAPNVRYGETPDKIKSESETFFGKIQGNDDLNFMRVHLKYQTFQQH